MGNHHQQAEINTLSFFDDPRAKELFARIDYTLKNGGHIQYTVKQESQWRFLESNFDSMKLFYYDFFGVSLEGAGESLNRYYYLEFMSGSRGGVPFENRDFLPNEYVIIGFLLYKIVYIDGYLELNSLTTLQRIIRQDNEDLKPGIYRALAKAKKTNTTSMDDEKVDDLVRKALKEFSKIDWTELDGDEFDILPSFQRLPKIYGDYINNPELWQKDESVS